MPQQINEKDGVKGMEAPRVSMTTMITMTMLKEAKAKVDLERVATAKKQEAPKR